MTSTVFTIISLAASLAFMFTGNPSWGALGISALVYAEVVDDKNRPA